MVQFGRTLQEAAVTSWAPFYLNYKELKKALKALKLDYDLEDKRVAGTQGGSRRPSLTAMIRSNSFASRPVSSNMNNKEDDFSRKVDDEVEKVVLFFLQEQGSLATRMLAVREKVPVQAPINSNAMMNMADLEVNSSRALNSEELDQLHKEITSIGQDMVKLLEFLQLNVTGLRKILKKHDKQIRDRLLAANYLCSRARVRYSFLQQLYHNEGIMALVGTLKRALDTVESRKDMGGLQSATRRAFGSVSSSTSWHDLLMRSTSDGQGSDNHPVVAAITDALSKLHEEQDRTVSDYLTLSSELLLEAGMDPTRMDEMSEAEQEAMKQRTLDPWSAYINLATTFLYLTNYYIVGPTGVQYSEALGGNPADSGLIIGMTPIAACISCGVYSYWTNTSFKGPLLACAVLLILGNIMYGLALSYDAFWMVLVGRLLIGLGGARGVNRRYIADTVPMEDRTFFSASFVAVGALGMAFGPFAAAVINLLDFEIGFIKVNGLTGPGWFMFIMWTLLGLATLIKFKEPEQRYSPTAHRSRSDSGDSSTTLLTPVHHHGHKTPTHQHHAKAQAHLQHPAPPSPLKSYGTSAKGVFPALEQAPSPGAAKGSGGGGAVVAQRPPSPFVANSKSPKNVSPAGGWADGNSGENSGLLSKSPNHDDSDDDKAKGGCCSASMPLPLLFCLFSYFINKLITEAIVSSAPLVTLHHFDWRISEVGMLMAAMGLVTLPVSVGVGRLSRMFEDRALMQWLNAFTALGCTIVMTAPNDLLGEPYTLTQYVLGIGVAFVALQAHEGVVMGITSKIIPAHLARGTFNSGFLATEAGTSGRFMGDIAITVFGVMTIDQLLNLLFIPGFICACLMIVGTWVCYGLLDV
eukprot:TRINITY_DN5919_c0_g1_i2.p1 TRINITY_DN5919_c0_g1~~TRINITY_DN5919_c0_g1_i2.p1  ORF type:complete len:863 (-),score=287.56 TRINITY_DN5919_c0_g1_i2:526-3114(-)